MFKTVTSMKYPNKLYSVDESVVGKMVSLMDLIPADGVGIEDFYYIASRKMSISDFIDAMTCLYMIHSIGVTKDNIVFKIC